MNSRPCCRHLHRLVLTIQCFLVSSYSFKSAYFDFRGHPIHYEIATRQSCLPTAADDADDADAVISVNKSPVLLLNGFGVGSFHQHKLVNELMRSSYQSNNAEHTIYCMDYLGQGKSWPIDCNDGCSETERNLSYSGNTWVDQIIEFLETIVLCGDDSQNKVHIVGNSVGGHLAVCVAALRPDLVESLCLLNATPVWGLNLPGWDGQLPAPDICRRIGRAAFDWIRDTSTIQAYLNVAYHNANAVDDELVQQIRSCTEGLGGHAAFASIMWSPPVTVARPNGRQATFNECLKLLECDVLLLFGRDDPWCKPAFAKRMLGDLMRRSKDRVQRYVELANVGHCPNHEAPIAVAHVLSRWLEAECRNKETLVVVASKQVVVRERWGDAILMELLLDDIPLSIADRLAITVV